MRDFVQDCGNRGERLNANLHTTGASGDGKLGILITGGDKGLDQIPGD